MKLWIVLWCGVFSLSVSAANSVYKDRNKSPEDLAKQCALRCLKEKHIGYLPCMGNCVNGKPLACGNGRVEKDEHCGNCGTDSGCAQDEDCLKNGSWSKVGGELHECAKCGDGIASRGENPIMFPDQACLIDYNGENGCGTKNGKCGFTSDCRCDDCGEKRPWMTCYSWESCVNTGRKYECVEN